MKSFTFLPLSLLIAWILTLVNATPLVIRGIDDDEGCDYNAIVARDPSFLESRRIPHPNVGLLSAWITGKGLPTVQAKPAIMFTGSTPTGARKLATKYGGVTFGDLTRLAKISYSGMKKDDIADVCAVWAAHAKGTVHAAIGKKVPLGSTYYHKEKPILLKNAEVKELLEYIVDEKGDLGTPVDEKKK